MYRFRLSKNIFSIALMFSLALQLPAQQTAITQEQIFPLPPPVQIGPQLPQFPPIVSQTNQSSQPFVDNAQRRLPQFPPLVERRYRIKDITFPDGDRVNNINGIGLVAGLAQTGGRARQTQIMVQNYFLRAGISVDTPETGAMSAVLVTGSIDPYARKGERFQVKVSVADDATSLRGGTLIRTPLRGIDGKIYAIAEGPLLGGGVAARGQLASINRDHPTVGVCHAILEREICPEVDLGSPIVRLILRNKEYSTAVSIANAINEVFPDSARAVDHGAIDVYLPEAFFGKRTDFISVIGNMTVKVDPRARVVINQKTGTIIMGQHVKIAPVVFAKGSLVISTAETPVVSQPPPLSPNGQTVVLPRSSLNVAEFNGPYGALGGTATVGELGQALNELGFTPIMMIEMFSSLQSVGALQAELIIE